MNFHLGKPILVLTAIALLSGIVVALRPPQRKADLTIWVFADSHYKTFAPLIPAFERRHNVKVNLNLLSARALSVRLGQLFMSKQAMDQTPDLVEVEIGQIGRFFRPPHKDVGFRPLEDYLARSGYGQEIVRSRFAPWSKQGVIYGVPHDVHPCTITYRDDLFREAGVDLSQARTWPQFHQACLQFVQYWRAQGFRYRHAIELPEASSDELQKMLLQRGINPIDSHGNVQLEDPRVAQTLAFYAQMVAGPRKISAQASAGHGAFARDLTEGNLCAFITPDWRITYIKRYGAALGGSMRMMPMPVFDPTDAPTSTWGGTMMGITKACKNPDLAWALLEYLYYSEEGLRARYESSDVLPPMIRLWNDRRYHRPDPFFGGQRGLFTELAPRIPARYVTPETPMATMALNDAVNRAVEYVKIYGDDGLEEACRRWLSDIADDLRLRMRQWRFD